MSRSLLNSFRGLVLTTNTTSTSPSRSTHHGHKSSGWKGGQNPQSLRRKAVYTSSGLIVPNFKSSHDIEVHSFMAKLKEVNPEADDIKEKDAFEALDTALRGTLGSKALRKAKRTGRGRTAEGDTAKFELARIEQEKREYRDEQLQKVRKSGAEAEQSPGQGARRRSTKRPSRKRE